MKTGTTALLGLLLMAHSPTAAAQSDADAAADPTDAETDAEMEARAEFERAREAYAAGRFEDALEGYAAAYALAPHPELVYNLANTHDRLGQRAGALRRYREFLVAVPDAENGDFIRRRIAVLEAELAEAEAAPSPAPPRPPAPATSAEPDRGATIALWLVSGITGLGGVATGAASFAVRGELEARCEAAVCPDSERGRADTMQALGIATDVLLGVSLTAFVVGLVVLLASGAESEAAAAADRALRF